MFPWRRFSFNVPPLRFCKQYECYPVAMLTGNERENVERGGKIIMPSSALEELTLLNISYPMLFRLRNEESGRTSHCGVLEFVADEGRVYLPSWMMTNLALNDGDEVSVESAELPVATYTKFQPQSVDFLDISDSKAVLENTLRDFACLTSGDCIAIPYNRKVYEVRVLETRPGDAVCIIECDMSVEFAAPVGYVAPVSDHGEECPEPGREFVPFSGQGNVLVNKKRKRKTISDSKSLQSPKPLKASTCIQRGVPDYGYTVGGLTFFRSKLSGENKTEVSKGSAAHTEPFSGPGYTLKPSDQTNL